MDHARSTACGSTANGMGAGEGGGLLKGRTVVQPRDSPPPGQSVVVMPPVEREGCNPAQAGFHTSPYELIRGSAQKAAEVALCLPFCDVGAYAITPTGGAGGRVGGAMTDPAHTLSGAGDVDLLRLASLTVLAASCVGPGGRRRFRRRPWARVRTRKAPPFPEEAVAAWTILTHDTDSRWGPRAPQYSLARVLMTVSHARVLVSMGRSWSPRLTLRTLHVGVALDVRDAGFLQVRSIRSMFHVKQRSSRREGCSRRSRT